MKREAPFSTKMKRLCRILNMRQYMGIGILESLWHLTARESPHGDIGKLDDEDIALYLDYEGEAERLIGALVAAKWLDRSDAYRLIVHDWHEHADDATKKKVERSGRPFVSRHVPTQSRHVPPSSDHVCLPVPEPVPVPDPVPVPEPDPEPEPEPAPPQAAKKSASVSLVQSMGWQETVEAALRAGMAIDPSTDSPFFKEVWAPSPVTDKAECVRGIYTAIDDGVLGPTVEARYIPPFRNYWSSRRWNEVRPRNRGQPKDKKAAARQELERLVKRDLEDANEQKIYHR